MGKKGEESDDSTTQYSDNKKEGGGVSTTKKNKRPTQHATSPSSSDNIVSKALAGIWYLMALQAGSRLFTFVLNTLIIIKSNTAVIGISSVEFQLFVSTILFLTREGIRRACLRSPVNNSGDDSVNNAAFKSNLAKLMNLAWLSLPIGIVVTCIVYSFFARVSHFDDPNNVLDGYQYALKLYAVGCMLEILSEPMYILAQNFLLYKLRVSVEGSATFLRCVLTYILISRFDYGLVAFGYAQVLFGAVLVVGYFGYFSKKILLPRHHSGSDNSEKIPLDSLRQLFPTFGVEGRKDNKTQGAIDGKLMKLYVVYVWQSIEKLVLTEGEKFVLMAFASFVNQAIYSVVNNLGSLVVRFLFQPIEEICFSLFSKLLANSQKSDDLQTGAQILRILTKFMITIGMIFIALGPNYSGLILDLIYQEKFKHTGADSVLAWYCVYVAVVAINGITEAFVHSVATPKELRNFNIYLISFSVVYVVAAIFLLQAMETAGLILANCINMGLRVAFSVYFIRKFFKTYKLNFSSKSLTPNVYELVVFITSSIITSYTRSMGNITHLGVGIFCGLSILCCIYITDTAFCKDLFHLLGKKKLKQK